MRKKLFSSLVCMLFIFCSVFTALSIFSVKANAQKANNFSVQNIENDMSYCSSESDVYVSLETDKTHFANNENIIVSYYVNSEESIIDINCSQNGFTVRSITTDIDDPNRIIVELFCNPNIETHSILIQIVLSQDTTLTAMLYAVTNEYGTYISPFSEDDAWQRYFNYAKKNNLMTQDEYQAIKAEFYRAGVIESEIIESPLRNDNQASTMAASSAETYVEGTLQWTDDNGNTHPLCNVLVRIYDKNTIGQTHLGAVCTDSNGYFHYTFTNADSFWDLENGGYDIFVRIYAGDTNAMVEIGDSGEPYYYESEVSQNVPTGSTVPCNFVFSMSSDLGRAFQISQAILTARNYAWNMMCSMPEDVVVYYPYGDICQYFRSDRVIHITGTARKNSSVPHSYASWDVIMHEYGHHIEYQLDINDSPKGEHTFNANLSDERENKDEGIRLAWAEAWPTVFGMQAQEYYSSYLQNIPAINDGMYDAYNFSSPHPVENNLDYFGDGCEATIIAVLWDLYDSANETNDTLALGHTNYWAVTTGNHSKTFSDFIGYFYEQYPSFIDDIGLNLSYYKMATTKPYISNSSSVSQTEPPTFNWTAQGGSTEYPNNSFVLIFYNSLGEEILRTAPTTSITYTLTQSEWLSVLYSYGKTYTVAVAATQTNSPTTGEYISAKSVSYTKPIAANLSQSLNISAYEIYTERVVNLQPGQYITYTITFATGGNNLIQTFGSKDAKIYLYDNNGNLVDKDDDSGYSQNAFLNYTVTAGVGYILKVQFSGDSEFGEIKIGITPASSIYSEYENILTATAPSASFNFPTTLNTTRVITFTPTQSGEYEFTTNYVQEPRIDTFLYVIDPVSTDACLFDDDYAGNLQALISTELVEGRTYFIVVSTYNITNTSGLLSLTIVKAQ